MNVKLDGENILRIRVKIGEVEIDYEQDDSNQYSAASVVDNYSSVSDRNSLMKTINEIAEKVKKIHDGLYA